MHIAKTMKTSQKLCATPLAAYRLITSCRCQFPSARSVGKHKGAVIEASMSPVKYATFAALGCIALQRIGYMADPSETAWMHAQWGFLGGAMLVIPFLTLLVLTANSKDEIPNDIIRGQLTHIVKEVIYSAIAACIGRLIMGGARQCLLLMMVMGAIGAFTSFVVLYAALGTVLGVLWIVVRCGVIIIQRKL